MIRKVLPVVVLTALIAGALTWADTSAATGASTQPAATVPATAATFPAIASERFVFFQDNLYFDKNVDEITAVCKRAAKAGYTGIVVTDCKFFRWKEYEGKGYEEKARKLRQTCRDLGLKFIAKVADQNTDLLSNDPNLAEGTPVVDAPFIVKDGLLVPADKDFAVANGSFEESPAANQPAGWQVTLPGKVCFIDKEVKASDGLSSLRIQDVGAGGAGNGVARQSLKVKPFRYYYLTAMVRTEDFDYPRGIDISIRGKKQELTHRMYGQAKTQEWQKIETIFNTLDNEEVTLSVGAWGGKTGKLWFDDIKVVPAGWVNIIRRDNCPLKLTTSDGKTVLEEGKDVAKVVDPKLGNTKWPGLFQLWYEQPKVEAVKGGRLKEGDTVLASYYHASMTYSWGVFACMNEPRTLELVKWQIDNVKRVLEPDGYYMAHDEIRHMGWDESCRKAKKSPAKVMADNVQACTQMIKKADPGKPIYVWSDMFDPYHNARKGGPYYLVKGDAPFDGSWEGLDKDVIVVCWWAGNPKRVESTNFFTDRGHKVILSTVEPTMMAGWLNENQKNRNVTGVMYTTWSKDYTKMEPFAQMLPKFKEMAPKATTRPFESDVD